jgi:osmotically-inducible protein OsmY
MNLPVNTEQILADFVVTSHILGVLKTVPQIPVNKLEVSTINGCVTLTGSLQCEFQKEIVNGLALKIAGVKRLKNRIAIDQVAANKLFWSYSAN